MVGRVIFQIAYTLLVLLCVVSLLFILINLSGDPVDALVPPGSSPEDRAALETKFGLDGSVVDQYIRYVQNALRGDFGESWRTGKPAMEMVADRFPVTLALVLSGLGLALAGAIPIGAIAGSRPGGAVNRVATGLALLGQAVPAFWLGTLLILVFSVRYGWFPASGRDGVLSFVLPAFALAAYPFSILMRLTRSTVADVRNLEYVRTARSKGLPESTVLATHILRNATLPVIAYVGVTAGFLIAGAIAVEWVFALPGMGQLAMQSLGSRDLPVLQAFAVVSAVAIVSANLIADIASMVVDPRVRESGGTGGRTAR